MHPTCAQRYYFQQKICFQHSPLIRPSRKFLGVVKCFLCPFRDGESITSFKVEK